MSILFATFILENFKISKFSKFASFKAITLYSYSHLIVKEKYTPNQSDINKKCENCYIIRGDNKLAIYLRSHLNQLPNEQTLCHQ